MRVISRPVLTGLGLLAVIVVVSACTESRRPPGGQRADRPVQINTDALFMRANSLFAQGNCPEAEPLYYLLGARGRGFELAQLRLGLCLTKGGRPGALDTRYLEGLVWIRRAAEANWTEAQGVLAVLYLEGPAALKDPAEAAMWLTLYQGRPGLKPIGFAPLDEEEVARLHGLIGDAAKAEGARRAAAWQPGYWAPPRMPRARGKQDERGFEEDIRVPGPSDRGRGRGRKTAEIGDAPAAPGS